MRNLFKIFIIGLLALFINTSHAATQSPKVVVQATIDEIVKAVSDNKGDSNLQKRRDVLRKIIKPKFDFDKMAQLSLGSAWNTITAQEQKDFVSVFSSLLSKTYLTKVESIEPGMVSVETERIEEGNQRATVKTLVKSKGDTFPIDYRLVDSGQGWKVYDVVIENIGLVVNYRNEFASIIRKDTFEGLMDQLRKKSAE